MIETLAAVALLVALATAVVPVWRAVGRRHHGVDADSRAQDLVRLLARDESLAETIGGPQPLDRFGHEDWYLHITTVRAERRILAPARRHGAELPEGAFELRPPDHRWYRLSIRAGTDAEAPVLATLLHPALPADRARSAGPDTDAQDGGERGGQ